MCVCVWTDAPSLVFAANEEYYQMLMINDSQPPGFDVSSYTIEEINSITSEYTLKNTVSSLWSSPHNKEGTSKKCIAELQFQKKRIHVTGRHLTISFVNFLKNLFTGRIYLLWPSHSSQGRLFTSRTRRRPSWTASGKCLPMPSLWSSWPLKMSACSTASPHPTACPHGACAPEQVPAVFSLEP